jgi:transcriptional regulator with PAS, ATPase and Fis domain
VTVCDGAAFAEEDLPSEVRGAPGSDYLVAESCDDLATACETFERNFIARALEQSGWNRALTARRLGVSYATMKNKIARYRLGPAHVLGRGAPAPRGRR